MKHNQFSFGDNCVKYMAISHCVINALNTEPFTLCDNCIKHRIISHGMIIV